MKKLKKVMSAAKQKALLILNKKRYETVSLEVAELFFQHNGEKDFLRYDMIVRLLAVEDFFGMNNFGFDFYRRMQAARNDKEWVDPAVERFKALILSYQKNGYDDKSMIKLDKNLHLVDGSHRMAMAMYYGIPYINASICRQAYDIFYGIEWFRINGFTEEECRILHSKYEALKAKYTTPFICLIWDPAREYFEEITEKLRLFGKVKEIRDFDFSERDYKYYTRGISCMDDMEKWETEQKSDNMLKSSLECYKIRLVSFILNQPDFRLKDKTLITFSRQGELIKKLICDAYKDKVLHCPYNTIIHIGENLHQNRHIYRLLTMPSIDMSSIFSHISERKYVLTKLDESFMPNDFPAHYPLGKGVVIICQDRNEYKSILDSILTDLEPCKVYYRINVVNNGENRTLVRLELENQYLVFQFDVSTQHRTGDAMQGFIDEMVSTRQERGVIYIPQTKFELLLRLQELNEHPEKVHIKDYVTQHIGDMDEQLCKRFLNFNWRKIIK